MSPVFVALLFCVVINGALGGLWYDGACGVSKYPDAGAPFGAEIVGGIEARPNEFPFQIEFQRRCDDDVYSLTCGGAIINSQWILTAAHCVGLPAEDYRVIVGEHIRSETSVVERSYDVMLYVVHDDYLKPDRNIMDNDIALVKIVGSFEFTEDVRPVCEPEEFASLDEYLGETVVISGWGVPESGAEDAMDVLNYISSTVLDNDVCRASLRAAFYPFGPSEVEVCAGVGEYDERDSCQGDSGGPMTIKEGDEFVLVGLTSHGLGCAGGSPGVYVRVSQFVQWVVDVMDANQ